MTDQRPLPPDDLDRLIDRQIDEGIDARLAPGADLDELEIQLRIDEALKRLMAPDLAPGAVDVAIDRAIDAGAATDRTHPEVRLQLEIDQALKRQFASDAPASPIRRRPKWHALAAAALLLAASAAILINTGYAERAWSWASDKLYPHTLATLYHDHVSSGVVMARCETPDEFQAWVEANFRESVRPAPEDEELTFVGWSYDNSISRYSGVMLGEARGEGVVVLIDRLERDHEMTLPEGSGLHLFRRALGAVVFYEITPLDEPVFIETFQLVDGSG
jgi:hypothetical protein